jgi:hypothetical protein
MKTYRWLTACALACAAFASNLHAATINVLWYSYAHVQSEYKNFYRTLATSGTPHSTGDTWNLTFFGPEIRPQLRRLQRPRHPQWRRLPYRSPWRRKHQSGLFRDIRQQGRDRSGTRQPDVPDRLRRRFPRGARR